MTRRGPHRTITASLPVDLVEKLDAAAAARDVGRRWLIERLLADGVDRLVPIEELRLTRSSPVQPAEPAQAVEPADAVACPHTFRYRYYTARTPDDRDRWRCKGCGRELADISTRRIEDGVVHEMADRGVDTLCGLVLREPWEWTDAPISCALCAEGWTPG
jgi:hypothetical protein